MKIKVFQINPELDRYSTMFRSHEAAMQLAGRIDPSIYKTVFDGNVDAQDLEDVFAVLNFSQPVGYNGHSLSVSDIVEIVEDKTVESGFYFCDSFGFRKLDTFDSGKCGDMEGQRVVYIAPNQTPIVTRIKDSLEAHQRAVADCSARMNPAGSY